jgi:hypothetical protein
VTPLRSFWWMLFGLAVLVVAGAIIYAQQRHTPWPVVAAVLPALLWEMGCYSAIGFPAVRERLVAWDEGRLRAAIILAAFIPAVIYPTLLGALNPSGMVILFLVVNLLVFWYSVFPRKPWADLVFAAALIALSLMRRELLWNVYPNAAPNLRLDFLGHLMLIRTAAAVMLLVRRIKGVGFGFIPTSREWKIGLAQFLRSMPFVVATGLALGIIGLGAPTKNPLLLPVYALATFMGYFVVVALGEEFLLRGVILHQLVGMAGSITAARIAVAVISGLVHLPFRGPWNWKVAVLSAVAHWFFGQAFLNAQSIRASMVTHSLVVTTWVMVFAKSA